MCRTASNKCNEPMMFDSKVATGSAHDTVGKLCAPKWKTWVGSYSLKICCTRCPLRRSHWTNCKRGNLGKESESCERYPPITFHPLDWRNLTRWDPINPSAPVTNAILFIRPHVLVFVSCPTDSRMLRVDLKTLLGQ